MGVITPDILSKGAHVLRHSSFPVFLLPIVVLTHFYFLVVLLSAVVLKMAQSPSLPERNKNHTWDNVEFQVTHLGFSIWRVFFFGLTL